MWRHQLGHYCGCSKNFRIEPFWIGSKNIYLNHWVFSGSKYRAIFHRSSKKPLSEGQEIDRSKIFAQDHSKSFRQICPFLDSYHSTWIGWEVFLPFWCLLVDKSRDTTKNIFQFLTVIIRKTKIRNIRSKWYLKLTHLLHWLLKYRFCDQRIIEPEVLV